MVEISEHPHSEVDSQYIPEFVQRSFILGEVNETVSDPVNVFTLLPNGTNFQEINGTVIALHKDPDGDEAWILPKDNSKLNVADRIRFMDEGVIEFMHCNGTEAPLLARYSETDGSLDLTSLELAPGLEVTVPARISSVVIAEIKNTFNTLKRPIHNSYSFSSLAIFAKSQELLDVFKPEASIKNG